MDYITAITLAAKQVGVSASILVAVCSHESGGFRYNHNENDKGTPSFGACQVKEATALQMEFKLNRKQLSDPKINAMIAAKYLKWQLNQYDNDYCHAVAAYNSGTYFESKTGLPKNIKYVQAVKDLIEDESERKLLNCKTTSEGNDLKVAVDWQ